VPSTRVIVLCRRFTSSASSSVTGRIGCIPARQQISSVSRLPKPGDYRLVHQRRLQLAGPPGQGTAELPQADSQRIKALRAQRDKLDIVPLTPSAFSDFTTRWHEVQTKFVDSPTTAVGVADRLVTEVMRERGYPVDDFEQRAADISVDHPQIVENYRAAHHIHLSQRQGDVSTEQQREAFVHYRALFEKLLETNTDSDASQEASA
jgi:hypothetical protein